jgi:hypothetical protein
MRKCTDPGCRSVYGVGLLAGIGGSNRAGGDGCLSVVSVLSCLVEVFATERSLVQRRSTEGSVS